MVSQLAFLLITGAAAGPVLHKDRATRLEPAVALDAAGHASNLAQQLEGSVTEQAKMLIRSDAYDAVTRTKRTEKDEPTSIQNMYEKQEQPCTPAMLIEYHKKQQTKQDPTTSESTSSADEEGVAAVAESEGASKKSRDEHDACAKLAAKINPTLAYGHVIITEPDGNISQVPGVVEDDSVEVVAKEVVSSTVDIIVHVLWMTFWVVVFCLVLLIFGGRWMQEEQVKKLRRDKDRGVVEAEAAPKAEAAASSSSAAAAAPTASDPVAGAAPVPKTLRMNSDPAF